jgi:hypothetical protein
VRHAHSPRELFRNFSVVSVVVSRWETEAQPRPMPNKPGDGEPARRVEQPCRG